MGNNEFAHDNYWNIGNIGIVITDNYIYLVHTTCTYFSIKYEKSSKRIRGNTSE